MIDETMPYHGFLFGDVNGPWSTDKLTKALVRESTTRLGFRMTIQEFRHIAIAIDKKFIRGHDAEADEDEDDEDDVHDLMSAHSSRIAIARYARMHDLLKGLTPESIDIFRKISDLWQRWFGLVSRQGQIVSTQPIDQLDTEEETVETKITMQLHNLYGRQAKFRSQKQREAVMAAANGTNELFIILPTGAGKSLAFMLPTMLPTAKTTVIITPLVALANDIYERCMNSTINVIIYGTHELRRARVVIVVTESAITDQFKQFITDLYLKERLDRIVFDECHKLIHDINFRPRMVELRHICMNVQFIFMTATFPPTMVDKFMELMMIRSPTIIRAANHKANVRYNVSILNGSNIKQQIRMIISNVTELCQTSEKVLVFCQSRAECDSWARQFNCRAYYSTSKDKDRTLAEWKSGTLFATGSLGAGVDISGIKYIIHVGKPYGMIDFDQEVGRGGRNGEPVESIILLSNEEFMKIKGERGELMGPDDRAMCEFIITASCRRVGMSIYMNGVDYEMNCDGLKGELCDNCIAIESNANIGLRRKRMDEEFRQQTRQRVNYEQKREHYRMEIMNEGQRRQLVLNTVSHLQRYCSVCWLLYGIEIEGHDGKKCPHLERELRERFSEFKAKHLRYTAFTCCFRCGLPQDLCKNLNEDGQCTMKDIIYPLVMICWLRRDALGCEMIINDIIEGRIFNKAKEFGGWMMEETIWLGHRATNGMRVLEAIIKWRGEK